MDQMVLKVQKWLNSTYGSNSNYTSVTEDGITGGGTVSALITALQIELGIQPADGVFGAATQAACPTLPNTSASKNEVYILQGALYCKGYNPNGFDGGYGNGVITAIKKFQSDAGLTTQDGTTTPMIFKALLNTDAYVLISGGDTNIRTIQQNLNRDYNSIIGLIPSNGVYSRSTNTALIKAVQHEEGNSTDGIWGSTTQAGCPTIPGTNATKKFILLLQYSLYCNGYNPTGFDGLYGNGLKTAIINFQQFVGLTADGYAGSQTWASLLVSTGDPDRKGTACDCSTTITAEKAATLKANGYEIVGRYLTGIYAMTRDELETIFANNLKVVPIFEVGGYNLIYFTSSQGASDANSAIAAANTLGFPDGTIIYFTVDFDALDIDVTNAIIPYFKAIKNTFTELGSNYKIGIYAPRNVCSRIANAGYSCSSFVCDMSSGFSGNLGYVLPQDWAFDQIRTVSIGSGSGHIEIDNDISSGKDSGVNCFIPIEALVNLANGILKVFKLSVTDLNVEQTISTGGIVVKWESGFKSDIGSGDVEFSVKNGQIEDFEAVANAISGSVGLSKNWFNDLGAAIKNGTIKISVKSNLSIEIEIDQEVPDDITITYPYLYTIIDISINDYINGLGSDVLNAVESAAPKVFAVAALVIAVCVIVELAPEVAVVALLSALTSVI